MNLTINDATVERFQYDDHDRLRRHFADFSFGRALKRLTQYEFIRKPLVNEPNGFNLIPLQLMPDLNS